MTIIAYYLIGIFLVVSGVLFKLYPPKEINRSLGYRTPFAMKNKETWNEGNRFFGSTLIITGILCTIVYSVFHYIHKYKPNLSRGLPGLCCLIIIIGSMIFTEVHLRRMFDKDGNRKGKFQYKN
ncbi:SdpI family protein [Clostridium frigidicarnis]|uniref:SdpI/YhfL protein family protein n=1 Tax=Clostridium frigidicarnis TaxID=84698 RepID=A0A1I1B9V1_9CLOT|nr:SdpI family protein [Clostridium frigidicarnis]SFB46572.1 SdpI/YhfL protein family protein [Clostridium frigidicarnis]